MKDYLKDIVQHTHGLGFIESAKIINEEGTTSLEAMDDDRTVIVQAKFKEQVPGSATSTDPAKGINECEEVLKALEGNAGDLQLDLERHAGSIEELKYGIQQLEESDKLLEAAEIQHRVGALYAIAGDIPNTINNFKGAKELYTKSIPQH